MVAKRTAKPKPEPSDDEAREGRVAARLSAEEKAHLDAVLAHRAILAREQGFPAPTFTDWLRAIIAREFAALPAQKGASPARKPAK